MNKYRYFLLCCCGVLSASVLSAQIQSLALRTTVDTVIYTVGVGTESLTLEPGSTFRLDSIAIVTKVILEDADLLIHAENKLLYERLSFSLTAVLKDRQDGSLLAFAQVYSKEVERSFVLRLKDVTESGLYPGEEYVLELQKTVYDENNHFLDGALEAPRFGWKTQRLPIAVAVVGAGTAAVGELVYRPRLREAETTYRRLWTDGAPSGDEQYLVVQDRRSQYVNAQRVGYGLLGVSALIWYLKYRKYRRSNKVYEVYAGNDLLLSPSRFLARTFTEEGRSGIGLYVSF